MSAPDFLPETSITTSPISMYRSIPNPIPRRCRACQCSVIGICAISWRPLRRLIRSLRPRTNRPRPTISCGPRSPARSRASDETSLLPVGVTPTTSRRIATRSLRRKMARSPIGWPAYTSSAQRKEQKPSPAAGSFFYLAHQLVLHVKFSGAKPDRSAKNRADLRLRSTIKSLPPGPGRNEFGPAVVRVRTAKSAVAGDHLLHAHFVGWQSAIVMKEIARISARAPRHLSGLADAKVEQHCHRYGHYDEH